MNKGKLCSIAFAGFIGLASIGPVTIYAAETNTESVTVSETNKKCSESKSAFKEKIKQAKEKWSTLTDAQKQEVYAILEDQMKAESNLMDKLVELGVLEKDDAEMLKSRMTEKFNEMKESGEFPFFQQKRK
jgi:ribosomal protein S20